MAHTCPAIGCTAQVDRRYLMCARHWRLVPRPLQAAIYETVNSDRAAWVRNSQEAVRLVAEAEKGRTAGTGAGPMKALTIWQPWASLIILKAKPFEFRRWNFEDKPHLARLIGQRIVIHAGSRKPRTVEIDDIIERIAEGESALVRDIALPFLVGVLDALRAKRPALPLSAALGTAVLGQPARSAELFADKVADSDRLDQHMYAWPLSDVQAFPEPIPAAGAQGFWNWS